MGNVKRQMVGRAGRAILETVRPVLWGVLAGGTGLALFPEGSSWGTVTVIVIAFGAIAAPGSNGRFIDRGDTDKLVRLAVVSALAIAATASGIAPNAFLVGCVFFVAAKTLRAAVVPVVGVAVAVLALAAGGLLVQPQLLLITGGPWSTGGAMRDVLRFAMLAALVVGARTDERRAADAERERDGAIRDERARIARELHDVVAHHVSVMTIQSEAAGLSAVAETGRTAMTDLRRMVGVLRSGEERPETAPQPGLDAVDRLVDDVRATGTPVALVVEGEPPAVAPDGLALSAYRIVQEALTNALRHAPGEPIDVRITYGPSAVRLEIGNGGRATAGVGGGGGHGIVGMEERARLLGGTLTAGPGDGGTGWVVRAELPR